MVLRRPDPAVLVTSAGRSHAEDIDLRQRRYVRSQLVRVACIAGGVLLPVPLLAKLAFFAAALVLPWFGVVMANAGPVAKGRRGPTPVPSAAVDVVVPDPRRVIEPD